MKSILDVQILVNSPVEIYKHRELDWRECCCLYEER